jgi:hypothetical protein
LIEEIFKKKTKMIFEEFCQSVQQVSSEIFLAIMILL